MVTDVAEDVGPLGAADDRVQFCGNASALLIVIGINGDEFSAAATMRVLHVGPHELRPGRQELERDGRRMAVGCDVSKEFLRVFHGGTDVNLPALLRHVHPRWHHIFPAIPRGQRPAGPVAVAGKFEPSRSRTIRRVAFDVVERRVGVAEREIFHVHRVCLHWNSHDLWNPHGGVLARLLCPGSIPHPTRDPLMG